MTSKTWNNVTENTRGPAYSGGTSGIKCVGPGMGVLILLILGAVVLSGCGTDGTKTRHQFAGANFAGKKEVTVPFELLSDYLPVVRVTLNDRKTFSFLVNPSIEHTYIFRDTMQQLPGYDGRSTGNEGTSGRRVLESMGIGGLIRRELPVRVVPRDQFSRLRKRVNEGLQNIDGFLGFRYFRPLDVTLNYPKKRLGLRQAQPVPVTEEEREEMARESEKKAPLYFSLSGKLQNRRYVTFKSGLNGQFRTRMAIDPTLPSNLISGSIVQQYDLETTRRTGTGKGFGKEEQEITIVTLKRLWIGGNVFRDREFQVVRGISNLLGTGTAAVLGYSFLKDLVVRINYPRRTLDFQLAK